MKGAQRVLHIRCGDDIRDKLVEAAQRQLQEQGYFGEVMSVIKPSPVPDDILSTPAYEGTRLMRDFATAAGYPLEDGTPGPLRHGSVITSVAVDWNAVRDELARHPLVDEAISDSADGATIVRIAGRAPR